MAAAMRSVMRWGRFVALAGLTGCSAMVGSAQTAPRADGAVGDGGDAVADATGDATDAVIVFDTGVPEDCATPFDDNGDGQANENCPCAAGAVQSCFPRPAAQLVDPCRAGAQGVRAVGHLGARASARGCPTRRDAARSPSASPTPCSPAARWTWCGSSTPPGR